MKNLANRLSCCRQLYNLLHLLQREGSNTDTREEVLAFKSAVENAHYKSVSGKAGKRPHDGGGGAARPQPEANEQEQDSDESEDFDEDESDDFDEREEIMAHGYQLQPKAKTFVDDTGCSWTPLEEVCFSISNF